MARNRKVPALAPEGLIDVERTCQLIGVSRPTLYRYMKDADFPEPAKHLGRTWFKETDIRSWAMSRGVDLPSLAEQQ